MTQPPIAQRQRQPVLLEPAEDIAAKVTAAPGDWYLIAGGDRTRLGSMGQTAWRIRRGLISAFAEPVGGTYEVMVTAAADRPDADYEVEMFLRWLPLGMEGK
jgi:hypothetical protein